MSEKQNIELLAPAKTADIGIEAILHGADAVYIGGPGFGARAAAGNSVDDIRRLCHFAHLYDARVYVTLNTILYDDEIPAVESLVRELYDAGVDALITQDLALLALDLPPIALHASTQMDNCTPERAKFLEAAGYSQIVLARELSLQQIAGIHAATSLPLEAFVHGALCVSYSGRCYASEYCFSRSANRGRCAQFCRLAFDLVDADGRVVNATEHKDSRPRPQQGRHLLSLRDMNRSAHLEAMMDAGVRSFKIEGRLKDVAYVKNVTAFYRRAIDEILERRSDDYQRASAGVHTFAFEPALAKSFNRGFTDYLLQGRTPDLWNFSTPKSIGEHVGTISRVSARSFTITLNREAGPLHNGDGCVSFINGLPTGFRANRVESSADGRYAEVFPLKMPTLQPGAPVYRNEDTQWEQILSRPSAERRMYLSFTLMEQEDGYLLRAESEGEEVEVTIAASHQPAEKPQTEVIRRQLQKLGNTAFVLRDLIVHTSGERFVPASLLSAARRQAVEALSDALRVRHLVHRDVRRPSLAPNFNGRHLPFNANISNRLAREWALQHGASQVDEAFELQQPGRQSVIMTCRHCLRFAFGQCPKVTGTRPRWHEPLALRLPDGRSFPLRFDCSRCEMQVLTPER